MSALSAVLYELGFEPVGEGGFGDAYSPLVEERGTFYRVERDETKETIAVDETGRRWITDRWVNLNRYGFHRFGSDATEWRHIFDGPREIYRLFALKKKATADESFLYASYVLILFLVNFFWGITVPKPPKGFGAMDASERHDKHPETQHISGFLYKTFIP